MSAQGYNFAFAVTLSGLHYLAAALMMQACATSGLMTAERAVPRRARTMYTLVSSTSILALNGVPALEHSGLSPGCKSLRHSIRGSSGLRRIWQALFTSHPDGSRVSCGRHGRRDCLRSGCQHQHSRPERGDCVGGGSRLATASMPPPADHTGCRLQRDAAVHS